MADDVIVLSGGLSGSSVVTGLIAGAGYWPGHSTEKIQYETYENSRLIELNREILLAAGFHWENESDLLYPTPDQMHMAKERADKESLRAFVEDCTKHSPFVWKDPRLVYTIHVWKDLLDLDRTRFIVADRDIRQVWAGQVLRLREYANYNEVEDRMKHSVETSTSFCHQNSISPMRISFEELMLDPDATIDRLNAHLGTQITRQDFDAVYTGPVGQLRWSKWDLVRARLMSALFWLRS